MALAVVLGGGGAAGAGWELGVVAGLADAGVGLDAAVRVVGTSAGALAGAALAAGAAAGALEQQLRQAPSPARGGAGAPQADHGAAWAQIFAEPGGPHELLRRMGAFAAAADTAAEERFVAAIAAQLPGGDWPAGADLHVTAVDAETGRVRVFRRADGVPAAAAVAASCAMPGVFPLVTIDGRRYFDGGMASPTHADLAAGCDEVLVIAPFTGGPVGPGLDAELARLGGARAAVVVPDAVSLTAIGPDPMDPAARAPAALAGRAQGRAEAMRVGIMLSL